MLQWENVSSLWDFISIKYFLIKRKDDGEGLDCVFINIPSRFHNRKTEISSSSLNRRAIKKERATGNKKLVLLLILRNSLMLAVLPDSSSFIIYKKINRLLDLVQKRIFKIEKRIMPMTLEAKFTGRWF